MQYLWITILLTTHISAETMSPLEHKSLHTYNKRLTLQQTSNNRAHKLHKIDEKEAYRIAKKICKSKHIKLILTHHSLYLYYIASTDNCRILINALDGSIINPTINNKKESK